MPSIISESDPLKGEVKCYAYGCKKMAEVLEILDNDESETTVYVCMDHTSGKVPGLVRHSALLLTLKEHEALYP